ncbi:hypothetical protein KIL84_012790 [Mauremys mutica]|uniref:Uncharacterized protein n=1 Tax=Mauremys mutica TaxID=74926 RepID=A0A9D3XQD6_9SAUR|nr:hypothetical protein KIL84_012790 [Mauremys mutica]
MNSHYHLSQEICFPFNLPELLKFTLVAQSSPGKSHLLFVSFYPICLALKIQNLPEPSGHAQYCCSVHSCDRLVQEGIRVHSTCATMTSWAEVESVATEGISNPLGHPLTH